MTTVAQVLDIEEAAPRPGRAAALVLRRADPRRASTQAWRLVPAQRAPAQRMACAHANLCVQPEHGLMGLQPGTSSGISFIRPHYMSSLNQCLNIF